MSIYFILNNIMKIIDTTTYFKEDLILDLRFNALDKFVDYFIVCEAKFSHSGNKKPLNFNKNPSNFNEKNLKLQDARLIPTGWLKGPPL